MYEFLHIGFEFLLSIPCHQINDSQETPPEDQQSKNEYP